MSTTSPRDKLKHSQEAFTDTLTRARMQAVSDEHAQERLEQLVYLRAVVKPWLERPVELNEVIGVALEQIETDDVKQAVDKAAARDLAAKNFMGLIENVAHFWQNTLTFFDGTNDAAGAALLNERVRIFMDFGRYWGRLPDRATPAGAVMFKYTVDGEGEEFVLQPDVLLEQVRVSVFENLIDLS